MKSFKFLFAVLTISLLFSCAKSEGVGGRATIKGKIIVDNINILGDIVETYDAQDIEVYIIYGQENNTFNDDVNTSHDGTFEFNHLNTGNYEVFLYSDCINCAKGQDSLINRNISISDTKEIIEIDTIRIANFI
tara:strand:+ start:387 stop:788 length:402 start_codon:yes stop_codon:yes gene_type:complete